MVGGNLFDVAACGAFPPGRVRLHWSGRPRETTPELERLIAETWERAAAECSRRGAMLYDGAMLRWIGDRVVDGVLHIETGPTRYRDFVGTNLYNPHRLEDFGRERFANPIGTTTTILSSDGWLVYGRRSHRVIYHAGYLHTFGGSLEEEDVRSDGGVDPFSAVHRELAEEMRLDAEHIDGTICVGLVHERKIWQPELLFETRVRLTRDELVCRLDPGDVHQEHVSIECVPDEPDALVPFVRRSAPVAPVAIAAMCLHGRLRWGLDWFNAAMAVLNR